MKKKQWITAMLVLSLLAGALTGCGAKSASTSKGGSYMSASMAMEETAYDAAEYDVAEQAPSGNSAQSLPQNRKWVITMDIDAETENLEEALAAVEAHIASLSGYVESQRINNSSGSSRKYQSASMTVRIPAEHVDDFVQALNSCTNVLSNGRDVKDITLAYTDTEGRITALKTEQNRLLELMAQAEDMSDLLVIEQRLTEVCYQLESYTSQLRRYDNQVDYATISLYISQVQQYTPVEKQGFLQRITTGFRQSIQDVSEGLVDFIVWLIVDLPYLVIWGLVIWAIAAVWRALRRRRKEKAGSQAEKKPSLVSRLVKKKQKEEPKE